jgi:hypothetical protein
MAALTTQSNLTATTAAETTAAVTAAINRLAVNQQNMQQQFAVFTAQHNTSSQSPPLAGISIPAFPIFSPDHPPHRQLGRRGQNTSAGMATTGGRNPRTPFANFMEHEGAQGGLPTIGGGGYGGGGGGGRPAPFAPFVHKN